MALAQTRPHSAMMGGCHNSKRSRSCSKVDTSIGRSWFCASAGI
jgi:hypothetical protein